MRRVNGLKLESFGDYYRHVINDRRGDGPPARRRLDQRDLVLPQPQALFVRQGYAVSGAGLPRRKQGRRRERRRLERRLVERRGAVLAGHGAARRPAGLGRPTSWPPICRRACSSGHRRPPGRWRRAATSHRRYLKRYMLRGIGRAGRQDEGRARDLRQVVTFRRMNLNDDMSGRWSRTRSSTSVFCRNVLMYFEAGRRERVLQRIIKRLPPRGYLFLGDAEGLNGFARPAHGGPVRAHAQDQRPRSNVPRPKRCPTGRAAR